MLSKRARPNQDQEVPKDKRLRYNVADLCLSSGISASRCQSVYEDAQACGARNVGDLARIGNQGKSKGNCSRDLLRKLVKGSEWPDPYYAPVRVWSAKKQKEEVEMLPILLPHELVRVLHQNADHPERLLSQENLGAESRRNLARAAQEIKAHPGQLIGLGLWGDGVPCNWDRSQSIECFTMSLPGIDGEWENMRMPIWATNKKFLVRHNTFDDVLTVVTWSLRCLAIGVMPSKRHDLSAWLPTDRLRSRQAKTPLPVKAVLCEVRGDWAFMKQCFRLPQSNEIKGCCWRCRVTPDEIRDASAGAPWRKQRLDHWDLIKRIHEDNANCSPLMGAPGLRSQCFAMDWLHVADLGITCNFLGGLFKLLLRKMEGRNESDRCSQLFLRMQQFYKENKTESRLDNLTLSMLRADQAKKGPKLRAKGAEARGLVPFAAELADQLLRDDDEEERAAKLAARALHACYQNLSTAVYDAARMAHHSRTFALLQVALETHAEQHNSLNWYVKPKLHMFQEMCEFGSTRPATCWTYRDEDVGGSVASYAWRRGGALTAVSVSSMVLMKFRAKHNVPHI